MLKRPTILIPVYNDWESLFVLLQQLDETMGPDDPVDILVVDDGSSTPPSGAPPIPQHLDLEVLRLKRNQGHQRAIAIGLAHLAEQGACEAVVVMDGDGEDSPSDVPRLLERARQESGSKVIFAERRRRAEGVQFRILYQIFKLVHWLLTGRGVRFGNFSVIPGRLLPSFLVMGELWNHYAAAVVKARIPYTTIPTTRRRRIFGRSRMALVDLVAHGLSAISVFADRVVARSLIGVGLLVVFCSAAVVATVWVRMFTDLAVPGWATTVAALLAVLVVQALTVFFVLAVFTLQARTNLGFLPGRDYAHFVHSIGPLSANNKE